MISDIDFLNKLDWDKNQIYIYQAKEGFFKRDFVHSVKKYCKDNKVHFKDASYIENVREIFKPTIMGKPFIYVNFDMFKKEEAEKILKEIIRRVKKNVLKNKMILIPSENLENEFKELESIKKKKICVIEEINISRKKKRDKLIDFLIENTDLYDLSKMKNIDIFNQSIYEVLSMCDSAWDLIKKFEYTLIMCIKKDMFDIFSAREVTNEINVEYFKMYRLTAELLTGCENMAFIDELFKIVIKDEKAKHGIIQNLYRVMTDLYMANEFFKYDGCPDNYSQYKWNYIKRYKKIKIKYLLVFSSILSKYEVDLKTNDFKYYLDVIVKEYKDRIQKLSSIEM